MLLPQVAQWVHNLALQKRVSGCPLYTDAFAGAKVSHTFQLAVWVLLGWKAAKSWCHKCMTSIAMQARMINPHTAHHACGKCGMWGKWEVGSGKRQAADKRNSVSRAAYKLCTSWGRTRRSLTDSSWTSRIYEPTDTHTHTHTPTEPRTILQHSQLAHGNA